VDLYYNYADDIVLMVKTGEENIGYCRKSKVIVAGKKAMARS